MRVRIPVRTIWLAIHLVKRASFKTVPAFSWSGLLSREPWFKTRLVRKVAR
jgi:hypothetical protein